MNMTRKAWLVPVLAAAAVCSASTLAAQEEEEGNQAAVAKAVMIARVSLERGLAASASHGQPISAKFEIEEGKLQLSVYTVKGGKFFEVIVDYNSGKVVKAEPITESEDLLSYGRPGQTKRSPAPVRTLRAHHVAPQREHERSDHDDHEDA